MSSCHLGGCREPAEYSKKVENIQCHNNATIKEYLLIILYNAETVSLRKDNLADADVSGENTGIDSTT